MQKIIPSAKKVISMCLVTLLLVTSTLFNFAAPAKADTAVLFHCESDCSSMSNTAAFAAGAIAGSTVTVIATGNTAAVTAAVTGLGSAVAPLAAAASPAMVAAAPVIAPVATVGAVGYAAYRFWESLQNSQAQNTK